MVSYASNGGWCGATGYAANEGSYSQQYSSSYSWIPNASPAAASARYYVEEPTWEHHATTKDTPGYIKQYTNQYTDPFADSYADPYGDPYYDAYGEYDRMASAYDPYARADPRAQAGPWGYDERHENVSDFEGNVHLSTSATPSRRVLSAEKCSSISSWLSLVQWGGPPPYDRNDPLLPLPPRRPPVAAPPPPYASYHHQPSTDVYRTDAWTPRAGAYEGQPYLNPFYGTTAPAVGASTPATAPGGYSSSSYITLPQPSAWRSEGTAPLTLGMGKYPSMGASAAAVLRPPTVYQPVLPSGGGGAAPLSANSW